MNQSQNKRNRPAKRAEWQKPEVRRVRAGSAEVSFDDFSSDIVFS